MNGRSTADETYNDKDERIKHIVYIYIAIYIFIKL